MATQPDNVYTVVHEILRTFERMACAAETTAQNEENPKSADEWALIAEIWNEAHELTSVHLSNYLAEQVKAVSDGN